MNIENHPIYAKHPIRPQTPEADVAAILASPEFFLCLSYNCRMSREACKRRRATAQEQSKGTSLPRYGKCLECNQVKEEPMDPKKCSVEGCNKPVKARGMCMTHYYREYSKGKFPTERTPADPPDPPAEKKPAKNIPKIIPNGTKRVNVQFSGEDVALWEKLKAQAKRNRRDLRTEALFIIEQAINGG